MNKDLDFLAVGDIVTDAFIRIKEAHINCDKESKKCELYLSYANKVPFEFVEIVRAVGNSSNAAVAAARLGLKASLVASIGDDDEGKKCLEKLVEENVNTDYVLTNPGKKTNYHYVLWYENDRTILVKHEEFDYSFPTDGNFRWIYLSSLGEHAIGLHEKINNFLETHPETKLVFQPGTFQIKLGKDKLKFIYEKTEIFFCNVEEAKIILEKPDAGIKELLQSIRALGPKIAVITDGPNGSYADDGMESFFLPAYPDQKPPYDRTGAGDAFASTTTAAIIKGLPLKEAMKWAGVNSMSVVGEVGAQKGLLNEEKIKEFIAQAPTDWEAKNI